MKDAMDILYCTGLYVAAQNGHKDIVKYISELDYTPSEDVLFKVAAFYLAAQNGLLDVIKDIMNKNFKSNIMDADSKKADVKNADEKHKSNDILMKIADNCVNIKNKNGNTWLHFAALEGDITFVNNLLEQGANPRALNNYHEKPIHLAALNGFNNIVRILLGRGVNVNASNKNKDTPLHYAVKNNHTIVVKELLKHGAKNLRNIYGYLPIHYSASDEIDLLLAKQEVVGDCKLQNNNTLLVLLHIAAENGHCDILKKILQSHVNIDIQNDDGETALHLASKGQYDAVKILIEKKANMECRDKWSYTPLHNAIDRNQGSIALLLIEAGANYESKVNDLCTSSVLTLLQFAAENGYKQIVDFLIKKEVDVADKNTDQSPLMLAAENGHTTICEILLDYNVDILNHRNKAKKTALHYAVINDHVDVVQVLLTYEAKLLKDQNNSTPLNIATSKNFKEIELILTKYQSGVKSLSL